MRKDCGLSKYTAAQLKQKIAFCVSMHLQSLRYALCTTVEFDNNYQLSFEIIAKFLFLF